MDPTEPTDITARILAAIRDEGRATKAQLDALEQRVDGCATKAQLGTLERRFEARFDRIEQLLAADIATSSAHIAAMSAAMIDLMGLDKRYSARLDQCERDIAELKART